MVLSGHLPLWNPWVGLGAPLLANYQSGLLYPPNWALLGVEIAWGQTLLVMLHLIWAGAGTALLLRKLGCGPFAQTVAGLSFGLSGYLVGRSGFLSINAAAAWLPWILLAAERALEHRNARTLTTLGLALGVQWLAGHAQTATYSWLLCAAWIGGRQWQRRGWSGIRAGVGGLLLASLLAFGLAAAQLVPTLEYLRYSDRSSGLDPEFVLNYSFWPWRALGLVAPDLFGNPRAGDYWGYGNYWEDHLYLGIVPLLLAIGAIASRGVDRIKWILLGTGALAFLLALGKNTPLFPWLLETVPGFAFFQAPTRWNLILVFGLAVLAGLGAERWRVAQGRGLYWLRLGTAGAAAAVVAAGLGSRLLSELEPTFAPAVQFAALGLLIAGGLGLARQEPPGPYWTAGVLGFVLVDLVFAARGLNPTLPLATLTARSSLLERLGADHRIFMNRDLEQFVKFELAFRFDSFQPEFDLRQLREIGLPNTPSLDEVPSANNFDPLVPAHFAAWLTRINELSEQDRSGPLAMADVGWRAEWDGAAVTYLPIRNPRRAWMVPAAQWAAGSDAALEMATAPDFDSSETVILRGAGPSTLAGGPGRVLSLEDRSPNRVRLTVSAAAGGWLVLADTWFPGWTARVDRTRAEIILANGVVRGVWVPPGEHTVEFHYRPSSVLIGSALSLLAWVSVPFLRRTR
jgi:hypothetical protein